MSDMEILVIPITFSLITFFLYRKKGVSTICKFIIAFWAAMSLFSYLFYIHPSFEYSVHSEGKVSYVASIYLIICACLWFFPLAFLKQAKKTYIIDENVFKLFALFTLVITIGTSIILIPEAIRGINLIDFAANKENAISGNLSSINTTIKRLFFIPYTYLNFLFPLLAMYSLSIGKKGYFLLFLCMSIIPIILLTFATSSRNYITYVIFELLVAFFLLKDSLSSQTRKKVYVSLLFFFILFSVLMISFSARRFSANQSDVYTGDFMILKYTGEGISNFNILLYNNAGKNCDGDLNFPLVRKWLGMRYSEDSMERRAYWSGRLNYSNYLFYTFIGSLVSDFGLEYGVILSLIVCFIFSWIIIRRRGYWSTVYLGYLLASFYMKGVFYNPYQSLADNYVLLFLVIVYFVLRFIEVKRI